MRTKQIDLICLNCEDTYNNTEKNKTFECRIMTTKRHNFVQFSKWIQLRKDLGKI